MLKTPQFWKNKNILSLLLYPLSLLYYAGYKLRILFSRFPYKSKAMIICIGNIVAGGAGKTPFALELGKILKKNKMKFAYLSKGYGGCFKGFMKVNTKRHNATLVGDEPLLLSEIADTFVCKDRVNGLKNINKFKKYKYIIMDDGLQNPTFKKDFEILVINGEYGLGNGFILPAGALRERLSDSLKKAQVVVLIGEDRQRLRYIIAENKKVKLIYGEIKEIAKSQFAGANYIAFSGIGHPEKFFKSLKKAGIKTFKEIPFPDHYQYGDIDMKKLLARATRLRCKLITTKKDWVRIDKRYRSKVEYLDIKIEFNNQEDLIKLIKINRIKNDK
jgi:tetraacyldisaccharide 4'-kinase